MGNSTIERPDEMGDMEFFKYCCQMLSASYNIRIFVNIYSMTLTIESSDEVMITTIIDELKENFKVSEHFKKGGKWSSPVYCCE